MACQGVCLLDKLLGASILFPGLGTRMRATLGGAHLRRIVEKAKAKTYSFLRRLHHNAIHLPGDQQLHSPRGIVNLSFPHARLSEIHVQRMIFRDHLARHALC